MLHPSYSDLMEVVNAEVEEGETPVVNSRYSIVMATSKRARQIVAGSQPLVDGPEKRKALSFAIEELQTGKVKIVGAEEEPEEITEIEGISEIGGMELMGDVDEASYDADEEEDVEDEEDVEETEEN